MTRFRFWLFFSCLSWVSVAAQISPPSQIELNGFLLGQYVKATDGAFGKPTQVADVDGHSTYRAYVFDQQHNGYMAFKFPTEGEKKLFSIQITGEAGISMRPFLGLTLGDDKDKVLKALGPPKKIEAEKDYPVDLYTYRDRNYSVEINKAGKLSSIEVGGYDGFRTKPDPAIPDIGLLKKLVLANDVDGLLEQLAGDLEIYRADHVYDFARSARTELSDRNSEIWKLLLGEKQSVRSAFLSEPFDPDQQIRMYEKGSMGSVAKFPHSKIIEEVVYEFEAGTWRVWEIRLR